MFAPHDAQEFTLPGNETIKHASAFVGGMGWVEAYLDGVKLGGDAVLEPGWSQWDATLEVRHPAACYSGLGLLCYAA